MISKTSKIHW